MIAISTVNLTAIGRECFNTDECEYILAYRNSFSGDSVSRIDPLESVQLAVK